MTSEHGTTHLPMLTSLGASERRDLENVACSTFHGVRSTWDMTTIRQFLGHLRRKYIFYTSNIFALLCHMNTLGIREHNRVFKCQWENGFSGKHFSG